MRRWRRLGARARARARAHSRAAASARLQGHYRGTRLSKRPAKGRCAYVLKVKDGCYIDGAESSFWTRYLNHAEEGSDACNLRARRTHDGNKRGWPPWPSRSRETSRRAASSGSSHVKDKGATFGPAAAAPAAAPAAVPAHARRG